MPITNVRSLERLAQLSGCIIPSAIADRIRAVADDPGEVQKIGIEVASELGAKLLAEGVPGLHFYTMNRAKSTLTVCANLGLIPTS
jgi:methylenetetrahydrofolate reductase (NADPH)